MTATASPQVNLNVRSPTITSSKPSVGTLCTRRIPILTRATSSTCIATASPRLPGHRSGSPGSGFGSRRCLPSPNSTEHRDAPGTPDQRDDRGSNSRSGASLMALGSPMAEQFGPMIEGAIERKPSGDGSADGPLAIPIHLATHVTRYTIREALRRFA